MIRLVPLTVLLLIVAAAARLWADPPADGGGGPPPAQTSDEEYYELLELFVKTLDQIERNYVQDVTRRELMEAAIEGMLSKLDQHSDYIPPDDLDRFRTGVENEFGGIGIQVSKATGELVVISPLVGSPAYRAGIVAGDVISHVEGQRAKDMTLRACVQQLKGPVGTKVTVTVLGTDGTSREVPLTREIVRVETVMGERRRDDDSWQFMIDREHKIGYIRITAFARHTPDDVRAALTRLTKQELRGLVLDLRYNPGGLLSAAIEISDLFIPKGRIVSTAGRNVETRHWEAHAEGTFEGFPMAVLVNRYSASASEIVAACLKDHERGVVIGERTFGKGSVQNIIELEGGRSALKLTTAGYRRPNGKNIDRAPQAGEDDEWGVRPSDGFFVEMSELETRQLALSRQSRDILLPAGASDDTEVRTDQALEKALDYLRGKAEP